MVSILILVNHVLPLFLALTTMALCGAKKKEGSNARETSNKKSAKKSKGEAVAGNVQKFESNPETKEEKHMDEQNKGPRAPAVGGMAATHDPNYQTLAGVAGECFGADKKAAEGPKVPVAGGVMAGMHDPNYQTLAGIGGDCFGNDKKGGPAAAQKPGMAAMHDPNYQTLAGIGGDCFGNDKKAAAGGAGGPKAPVNHGVKAAAHDPNYQTLAGIGGDCFGADKKAAAGRPKAPKAPVNQGAKAATHDPNYQTLVGIGGNECFGKDKKK